MLCIITILINASYYQAIMERVGDIGTILDLRLSRLGLSPKGYLVKNWEGIDTVVCAVPQGAEYSINRVSPAYLEYIDDKDYHGIIVFSPLPITKEGTLEVWGGYQVDLETRKSLPEIVKNLIIKRERLFESIAGFLEGKVIVPGGIHKDRKRNWKKILILKKSITFML